jgi:hypothetical protein
VDLKDLTKRLHCTFTFDLPSNATSIVGIEARLTGGESGHRDYGPNAFFRLRLIKNGSLIGSFKATVIPPLDSDFSSGTSSPAQLTVGGAMDLWNTSGLTVGDIDGNTTFGVSMLGDYDSTFTTTLWLDQVELKVYYGTTEGSVESQTRAGVLAY